MYADAQFIVGIDKAHDELKALLQHDLGDAKTLWDHLGVAKDELHTLVLLPVTSSARDKVGKHRKMLWLVSLRLCSIEIVTRTHSYNVSLTPNRRSAGQWPWQQR